MDNPHDSWGVVIGRFQSPYLHLGHRNLLNAVMGYHANLMVLVGVRPASYNQNNPLPFAIRCESIWDMYPNAMILPVMDARDNDSWSKSVDQLIKSAVGLSSVTLYTGRDGFRDSYTGSYPVQELRLPNEDISATDLRNKITFEEWDRPNQVADAFRAGMIHATQLAGHRMDLAVDIAIMSPKNEILLGRKPGEKLLRFPGGMFDHSQDESFLHAATRELREETGISAQGGHAGYTFLGDFNVDDWRCRDTDAHSYRTMLFTSKLSWYEKPKGADDLDTAAWFYVGGISDKTSTGDRVTKDDIVPEHHMLWDAVLAHYITKLQQEENNVA